MSTRYSDDRNMRLEGLLKKLREFLLESPPEKAVRSLSELVLLLLSRLIRSYNACAAAFSGGDSNKNSLNFLSNPSRRIFRSSEYRVDIP